MTQLQAARAGRITVEMAIVAAREGVTPEFIRDGVARGRIVIPANVRHRAGSGGRAAPPPSERATAEALAAAARPRRTVAERRAWLDGGALAGARAPRRLEPVGIGRALTTKVNANLGASPLASDAAGELRKLRTALLYGADCVMDLSTGGDLDACRQLMVDHSPVPVGTVPIYSMIVGRSIEELDVDTILRTIERQAQQGVDFFTIHAGLRRAHLPLLARRTQGIVSRGGALLAQWMTYHGRENPLYERFDDISAILREYDVTYSLGDGLRPGCLADAGDPAQLAELRELAELVQRARDAGVQVMVEGPGHVPLNEVAFHIETQRRLCDDAPFYVLGPVVTDVFPGFDHITSAIGATEAARAGAALLCYVTPREHVGLPDEDDVRMGCIAYRIAAHAGDVARGVPGAAEWDHDMARARAALDWPRQFALAFDGDHARALRDAQLPADAPYCSMCGRDWCSQRLSRELRADCLAPAPP